MLYLLSNMRGENGRKRKIKMHTIKGKKETNINTMDDFHLHNNEVAEKVQVKGTNRLWNSSYFGRETVKDSFVDHSQQWHNEKVGHGTGSP